MTGFDAYLESLTRIPAEPTIEQSMAIMVGYRKSIKRLRMPSGGAELKRIRSQGQRPACRVLVTADDYLAAMAEANGDAYPLLIHGHTAYDFSPLFRLDVLYAMPDSAWGVEIAHQITEAWPRSFALIWPGNEQEEVLWS